MRILIGIIIAVVLSGCSTMKSIGNSALRVTAATCVAASKVQQTQIQQQQGAHLQRGAPQPRAIQTAKCVCGLMPVAGLRTEATPTGIYTVRRCSCGREVWIKN